MKLLKFLKNAFHGKGYKAYTSTEAQKKFGDTLIGMAGKCFWAPMAYLGVSLYQEKALEFGGFMFVVLFFLAAVCLRHQGLKIFDYIEQERT